MHRLLRLVLMMMISAGCNLSTTEPTRPPLPTDEAPFQASITPLPTTAVGSAPNIQPIGGLAGTSIATVTLRPTNIPVTSVPLLGVQCEVYRTYSGPDPNNLVSLRSTPTTTGTQVFRVPNNAPVLRVPNTDEVAADDYHWLNVIYVGTTGVRYMGWIARDSYNRGGVRDTSIETLVPTGTQAAC